MGNGLAAVASYFAVKSTDFFCSVWLNNLRYKSRPCRSAAAYWARLFKTNDVVS